jgi:hypothetical protein
LSPFAVLQIDPSASKEDIKKAFRKLVKMYHPDINPCIDNVFSTRKMTEITEAYDKLMDEDYSTRWGDHRVAMACEMYTLDELLASPMFAVYTIQILYSTDTAEDGTAHSHTSIRDARALRKEFQVLCDPFDSVSDLKRLIQSLKFQEWGLHGRAMDRDKLAKGWELVFYDALGQQATILSYHLFLHSYPIVHRQLVYAVVQK